MDFLEISELFFKFRHQEVMRRWTDGFGFDGVAFSEDNIKNGTYKLFGVEHMYTKGEAKDPAKAFIAYISSKEFQGKQVRDLKFLPADLLKK